MQPNLEEPQQPKTGAVRSMTGYGRARQLIGSKEITVEIRSVNHRFLEYSSRVPRAYAYLEEKLKNLIKGSVSRGKVDVSLSIQTVGGTDTQVVINHDLARSYLQALRSLAEDLQIKNDITVSQMARFSDIFSVIRVEENEEEIWQAVEQVAREAVDNFVAMRLTEAAIFAEKIAVAEETVRLGSHVHQFRQILSSSEPVGRKLDFLVQEFNREANTIGSKAQDLEVARIVVDLKAEIEKIREQIQNVE